MPRTAKAILAEALDTIQASYWVKGEEVVWAGLDWETENEWEYHSKAITLPLAKVDDEHYSPASLNKQVKITGVCSIGALALANVTLSGMELTGWDNIASRDRKSWFAGAALAMAIFDWRVKRKEYAQISWGSQTGGVIANWNDDAGRTKTHVVTVFKKAMEHPLTTASQAWQVGLIGRSSYQGPISGLIFPTKTAAKAFLTDPGPVKADFTAYLQAVYGAGTTPADFEPVKVVFS